MQSLFSEFDALKLMGFCVCCSVLQQIKTDFRDPTFWPIWPAYYKFTKELTRLKLRDAMENVHILALLLTSF